MPDHFSKFVWLQPMRHAVAAKVLKFLEAKIFHQYGVPEFIHSDNGKQFVSQIFGELMTRYGIRHVKTGLCSPQANAAERVNRSVLQILRATIATDQQNKETQLSRIECALRNGLHESIVMEPYYAMFGTRMVTHGTAYPVLRKLGGIQAGDPQISLPDKMELIRQKVTQGLYRTHERAEKAYKARKNYRQSSKADGYNAKLDPNRIFCVVLQRKGKALYELGNAVGKSVGVFHPNRVFLYVA